MRLKRGADPRRARQDVDQLHAQLGNLNGTEAEQARHLVDWAQQAEVTLGNHFTEIDLDRIYTPRLWRISVGDIDLRSYMITREQAVQLAWLVMVRDELDRLIGTFGSIEAAIAVPDTNALLHYRLFDEIAWPEILGRRPVKLVVPIAVVDELDRKKAHRNAALAQRARAVIKHLRDWNGRQVREDVELAIIDSVELGVGRRSVASLDVDLEILDACEALGAYAPGPVRLVSGDYGMELRAGARQIEVAPLPDGLLQPLASAAEER